MRNTVTPLTQRTRPEPGDLEVRDEIGAVFLVLLILELVGVTDIFNAI